MPKPIPLLNLLNPILYFQYTYPLLKLCSFNTDCGMVKLPNPSEQQKLNVKFSHQGSGSYCCTSPQLPVFIELSTVHFPHFSKGFANTTLITQRSFTTEQYAYTGSNTAANTAKQLQANLRQRLLQDTILCQDIS